MAWILEMEKRLAILKKGAVFFFFFCHLSFYGRSISLFISSDLEYPIYHLPFLSILYPYLTFIIEYLLFSIITFCVFVNVVFLSSKKL